MGMFDDLVPQKPKSGGMFDDLVPQKQRSWSDVPGEALANAPGSAAKLGGAIWDAVTSPVQTVKELGDVAAGGLRNAAQAVLPTKVFNAIESFENPERMAEIDAKADAVGQFYKDRYGSAEGLKTTLATDPVGAMADAATVLYGGGAVAPGRAGAAIRSAGSAVDPIANAGRVAAPVANFAGRRAADVLGVTTGAGSRPLATAFEAGQRGNTAFRDHMRGQAPIEDVVGMAENAVDAMGRQRSAAYNAGKAATNSSQEIMNLSPINGAFMRTWEEMHHKGVPINEEAVGTIRRMYETYEKFREATGDRFTPSDMDAFKQAVRGIRDETKQGTRARLAADRIYSTIGRQIEAEVPGYAATMRDYANASDEIREVRRSLSVNDRASADTTLRKLQSTQRNNVNTNYGARQRLVDALAQHEPDLPYALAGQALNDYAPRGLSRIMAGGAGVAGAATMNPTALAFLPAASPRMMGEAAFGAGRASGAIERAARRTGMSPQSLARLLMALQASGNISRADEK